MNPTSVSFQQSTRLLGYVGVNLTGVDLYYRNIMYYFVCTAMMANVQINQINHKYEQSIFIQ